MKTAQTILRQFINPILAKSLSGLPGVGSIFLEYDMKKIPLVNNNNVALVDDEDFDIVSVHRWYIYKDKNTNYALTFIKDGTRWVHTRMHRLIMGAIRGTLIDHINSNGLDNRRDN